MSDFKCKPGRDCLSCAFDDCILTSVHRVFPEESEMIQCAELPQPKKKKNRRCEGTDGSAQMKKEVLKTKKAFT